MDDEYAIWPKKEYGKYSEMLSGVEFRIHVVDTHAKYGADLWNYPPRRVPSNCIYLMIGGDGRYEDKNKAGKLAPGRAYLLPVNTRLRLWCEAFVEKAWISFDLRILPGLDLLDGIEEVVDLGAARPKDFGLKRWSDLGQEVSDWFRIESLVLRLVSNLGPRLGENIVLNAGHHSRYAPLYHYVHDNLSAELRVSDLARLMQMTPEHLTRSFKADRGMTVKQFLSLQLSQRAMALVAFDRLFTKEIAATLKFRNVHEFTRFFTHAVGVSPTVYRSSHRRALNSKARRTNLA